MLKLNLFFYLLILIALYHCKLHVVARREPKGLLTRTTMTTLDERIKLLNMEFPDTIDLGVDNTTAISFADRTCNRSKLKHID